MKPMIIFKEKNKNGKYEFTEEEFKAFIENAFDEGYAEGKKASTPIYPILNPAPDTTPTYPSPNDTGERLWWNHQPITCGQDPRHSIEFTSATSKPDSNVTLRG